MYRLYAAYALGALSVAASIAGCNARATTEPTEAGQGSAHARPRARVEELTINGNNGQVHFAGDAISVANGELRINGVPYGRVHRHAVIRYVVIGNSKALYVDEVLRRPAATAIE